MQLPLRAFCWLRRLRFSRFIIHFSASAPNSISEAIATAPSISGRRTGIGLEGELQERHVDHRQLQDEGRERRPEHEAVLAEPDAEERAPVPGVDRQDVEDLPQRQHREGNRARDAVGAGDQISLCPSPLRSLRLPAASRRCVFAQRVPVDGRRRRPVRPAALCDSCSRPSVWLNGSRPCALCP